MLKGMFRKNSKTQEEVQAEQQAQEQQQQQEQQAAQQAAGQESVEKAVEDKGKDEAAKKMEWKFGQRSDVKELVARGIVGSEYEAVLKGDKDIEDAEKEHVKSEESTKNKIDKVFKMDLRPSADDVEDRGIAPQGSLAGATKFGHEYKDEAVSDAENEKKATKEKLAAKFGQRMQPQEAIARNIIDEHALDKV